MWVADKWKDFELIDAGDGEKIERWGSVILQRPDPQVIWPWADTDGKDRPQPHAIYRRSSEGGGYWEKRKPYAKDWQIRYDMPEGPLEFRIEPTGFKHTGLFPEQAVNWEILSSLIRRRAEAGQAPRILNLFAYTGAASVVCAQAGAAEVVHIDASKNMNARAKLNLQLSGLEDRYVRFISDDVRQFVEREIRRGRTYDGILMDPPAYGRGPSGELWKLEEALFPLVSLCASLLSDQPLFYFINAYTTGLAPSVLSNLLNLTVGTEKKGTATSDEIGLPSTARPFVLPCGATGRWVAHD